MPAIPASPLARVLDFQRRTVELVADEMRPIAEGWVARTPSLPAAWWLNNIWVGAPLSFEDLMSLCEQHRRGATFDHLHVDEAGGGQALEETFRAHRWAVEVELHMVLTGEPDRELATAAVIEPRPEESLALMERWIEEDETLHLTPDGVRQLVDSNRRTWPLLNTRRFGVRGPGGGLQGTALLYSDGSVAQVENVYVVPDARGHDYARAMVAAAVAMARAAGHELTFIVADDNDWPKRLYATLGFEPVGRTWWFHRELGAGADGHP